jgi:hypothetical protein
VETIVKEIEAFLLGVTSNFFSLIPRGKVPDPRRQKAPKRNGDQRKPRNADELSLSPDPNADELQCTIFLAFFYKKWEAKTSKEEWA